MLYYIHLKNGSLDILIVRVMATWIRRSHSLSTRAYGLPREFGENRSLEVEMGAKLHSYLGNGQFLYPLGSAKGNEGDAHFLTTLGGIDPFESLGSEYKECIKTLFEGVVSDDQVNALRVKLGKFGGKMAPHEPKNLLDTVFSWNTGDRGSSASFDFLVRGVPCEVKAINVPLPKGLTKAPSTAKQMFLDKIQADICSGWGAIVLAIWLAKGLPVTLAFTNGNECMFVNLNRVYSLLSPKVDTRKSTYQWGEWVPQIVGLYDQDLGTLLNGFERNGISFRNNSYDGDDTHSCLPVPSVDKAGSVVAGKSSHPRMSIDFSQMQYASGIKMVKSDNEMSANALNELSKCCSPVMAYDKAAQWVSSAHWERFVK